MDNNTTRIKEVYFRNKSSSSIDKICLQQFKKSNINFPDTTVKKS